MEKDPLLDYRGQTLLAVAKTGSLTAAANSCLLHSQRSLSS